MRLWPQFLTFHISCPEVLFAFYRLLFLKLSNNQKEKNSAGPIQHIFLDLLEITNPLET